MVRYGYAPILAFGNALGEPGDHASSLGNFGYPRFNSAYQFS